MRQARLVAGFQREHLPSEESGEESRLIHPGHTSISSLYDWVGCFFFCCSFSVCSADLPFGGRGDRAGALRRVRAAAAPSGPRRAPCPCHEARGCRQERLEKTGLVQELEAPRVLCSQSEYVTLPRASVSPPEAGALPLRGVFGLERGQAKPSCCSGRLRRMAL